MRERFVKMKGNPVTLLGAEVDVGRPAPEAKVVNGSFQPVHVSGFRGKTCLISVVPSLDTGVCAAQTKRFNEEIAELPDDVVVVTISMDLPFAQKRFCEAEKVQRIQVLSDHVWHEFGINYGVLIKDMGLLARSVFIVDRQGTLVYKEIVPEVSRPPDYEAALEAVRSARAR